MPTANVSNFQILIGVLGFLFLVGTGPIWKSNIILEGIFLLALLFLPVIIWVIFYPVSMATLPAIVLVQGAWILAVLLVAGTK